MQRMMQSVSWHVIVSFHWFQLSYNVFSDFFYLFRTCKRDLTSSVIIHYVIFFLSKSHVLVIFIVFTSLNGHLLPKHYGTEIVTEEPRASLKWFHWKTKIWLFFEIDILVLCFLTDTVILHAANTSGWSRLCTH